MRGVAAYGIALILGSVLLAAEAGAIPLKRGDTAVARGYWEQPGTQTVVQKKSREIVGLDQPQELGMAAGKRSQDLPVNPVQGPGKPQEAVQHEPAQSSSNSPAEAPGGQPDTTVAATVLNVDQSSKLLMFRTVNHEIIELRAPEDLLHRLEAGDRVEVVIRAQGKADLPSTRSPGGALR